MGRRMGVSGLPTGSSTVLQLIQIAMLVLPAVTQELKYPWQYRPKVLLLPHGSWLELNLAFLLEKSGAQVDML